MRRLIVSEFVSLDGVIQAPGGADEDRQGSFRHGGWTAPYWHDDIGKSFFALMQEADALLLGRKSLQTERNLAASVPWCGDCNAAKRRSEMRDGTKVAGALLRSELYRRRDAQGRPAEAARNRPTARGSGSKGAGASPQRDGSGAVSSTSTALALLALLDLFAR